MKTRIALTLLAVLALPAAPAAAQREECCPGPPECVLTLPRTVGLGEWFTTCIEAPPGSLAFILISDGKGPLDTKYGPLCLDYPFLNIWPVLVPFDGFVCLDHFVACDINYDGFTGYFQFVAVGPDPWQVCLSNGAALTALDTGTCIPVGDFYGWTQGAWGGKCAGNNLACLRDQWFGSVFPGGLVLGDPDGPDADGLWALKLTSAAAVEDFLPSGGTSGALDADVIDPVAPVAAGNLAAQLAATKLNLGFDDAGVFDAFKNQVAVKLGDLVFSFGGDVHAALVDHSVRELVALADEAISGAASEPFDIDGDGTGELLFSDLNSALAVVNENFDEGLVNEGNLKLP